MKGDGARRPGAARLRVAKTRARSRITAGRRAGTAPTAASIGTPLTPGSLQPEK
jgi:hypothetical protein